MKISREEDYAIALMAILSKNRSKGYLSLGEISRRHRLPFVFLKNIARRLKLAGLVAVREGREGGYKIARKPQPVTLGQILSAFNSRTSLTSCVKGQIARCPVYQNCQNRESWDKISRLIYGNLNRIKLNDFMKK